MADTTPTAARDRALGAIARRVLSIPTLETRHSDRLDFHDVAVWSVAEALRLAWSGGYEKAVEDREDGGGAARAPALALAACQALSDYAHNFYDDIGDQIAPIVEAARAALAAAGRT